MVRTGRRPGSTSTRASILAAAAECFAADGYDATSMRHVAAAAGVDPALVRRFFGGKEQLFSELATALIVPERAVAAVTEGAPEAAGERLLRYFLSLLGDVSHPEPFFGLIRSAVASEHAAGLLRRLLAEQVLAEIAASFRAETAELGAALAASQLVGLAIARYAVRLDPLAAAGPDDLVRWVAPVIQSYLTGRHLLKEES
jgi:AcrR family transcriptional regulator